MVSFSLLSLGKNSNERVILFFFLEKRQRKPLTIVDPGSKKAVELVAPANADENRPKETTNSNSKANAAVAAATTTTTGPASAPGKDKRDAFVKDFAKILSQSNKVRRIDFFC